MPRQQAPRTRRLFGLPARRRADAPRIFVPIGLPGAGKTTWATQHQTATRVICPDQFRDAHYPDKTRPDGLIPALEKYVMRDAYAAAQQNIDAELSLIFDACNLTPRSRARLINASPRHEHIAVVFETDLLTCIERNADREFPVPEEVIRAYAERLVPPVPSERWDDVWFLQGGPS